MSSNVSPSYSPLVINLDVQVDASGHVQIFGQPAYTPVNPVVCGVTLPVADLYVDASDAMFEFQEGSTREQRVASLAVREGRSYLAKAGKFAKDLQAVLVGAMDASDAAPFRGYSNAGHNQFSNFGELALGLYAHHLLGHVAATAAITNDSDIIANMLSRDKNSGVYNYASQTDAVDASSTLETWAAAAGSVSDADLARRLIGAVLTKSDANILKIAEQVLRDTDRALNEDNSAFAPGDWAALKFIAGDKICMQITIPAPTVAVTDSGAVPAGTIKGRYPTAASDPLIEDSKQFTLIITLA